MLKRAIFGLDSGTGGDGEGPDDGAILSRGKYEILQSDDDDKRKRKERKKHSRPHLDKNGKCTSRSNVSELRHDPKICKALLRQASARWLSGATVEQMKEFVQVVGKRVCDSELTETKEVCEEMKKSDDYVSADASDSDDYAIMDTQRSDSEKDDDADDQKNCSFRGNFQCTLCPERIFIFEADLQRHIESKVHKKRQARWEAAQSGEKASLTDQASISANEKKKFSTCETKKKKKSKGKERKSGKKRSERRLDVSNLPLEIIEKRKRKFQEKKKRAMERKKASGTNIVSSQAESSDGCK